MGRLRVRRVLLLCSMIIALFGIIPAPVITADELPFADPAFENVWQQADATVASGETPRSWLWGPAPIGVARDYYAESTAPDRQRLVQYFDKSRMEITHPDGDTTSPWHVTNGLLVKELVSGMRQRGDNQFQEWSPARSAVAGDLNHGDNLSYADFESHVTLDGASNRASDRTGAAIDASLLAGTESGHPTLGNADGYPTATYGMYEPTLGHNIADVFWNWMNNPPNGILTYGSWVYPMGYPISEPYWTVAVIGGTPQQVLVQLFERRVLTYNPTNPAAWQVEMGNVGAAYMQKFENDNLNSVDFIPNDSDRIVVNVKSHANDDIISMDADGSDITVVANTPWDEYVEQLLPTGQVLYQVQNDEFWTATTPADALANEWSWPNYSPDMQRVAHACNGICITEIATGTEVFLENSSVDNGTLVGDWLWSPDGRYLAFRREITDYEAPEYANAYYVGDTYTGETWQLGPNELYTNDERYMTITTWISNDDLVFYYEEPTDDNWTYGLRVLKPSAPGAVSDFVVPDALDVDASASGKLVISRESDTWETSLWTADADGSNLTQITTGPSHYAGRWNAAGTRIVFIDYDPITGDPGISVVNADGSGYQKILQP